MTSNTQPQDLVNDQNDDDAALDRKPSRYSFDEASHRDEDSQHDERKGDRARIRRSSHAVSDDVKENRFARPYAWLWLLGWWVAGALVFFARMYHKKVALSTGNPDPRISGRFWGNVSLSLPATILLSFAITYCERSAVRDRGRNIDIVSMALSGLLTGPASAAIQLGVFDAGARAVSYLGVTTQFAELLAGMVAVNFAESHLRQIVFFDNVYPMDFFDIKRGSESILPAMSVALSVVWTGITLYMYAFQSNIMAVIIANMVSEALWAYIVRLQFALNVGAPSSSGGSRKRRKVE